MFKKLIDLGLSSIKSVENFIDSVSKTRSTRLQRRVLGLIVITLVMSIFLFLISR